MPDLTTRARREAMDSEDFAALDFLVGAIAERESVSGVGVLMLQKCAPRASVYEKSSWAVAAIRFRLRLVISVTLGVRQALTRFQGRGTNRAKGIARLWCALLR